jgi:hypothetical protein
VVKIFFTLFLLTSFAISSSSVTLEDKVIGLVDKDDYKTHKGFIDLLFKNKNKFITNSNINIIKVIKTLQDNGLFKYIFKKPVNMNLTFEADEIQSLLLTIKSIQDSLNAIGYSFFTTTQTIYNNNHLKWSINLKTNVAIDPILLNIEFVKRGIVINDIIKYKKTKWTYLINANKIRLSDVYKIQKNTSIKIKKYTDIFIQPTPQIEDESKIHIISHPNNTWYPYIVFYDEQLNILKIKKYNKIIKNIKTQIPVNTYYIKISDIYINKNFNNGFKVSIE